MKKILLVFLVILASDSLFSQVSTIFSGSIKDAATGQALGDVSILAYSSIKTSGTISNSNGFFSLKISNTVDSIRFSRIGYAAITISSTKDIHQSDILMQPVVAELREITVKPLSANEIVLRSIESSTKLLSKDEFQTRNFYREIISDSSKHYSVAEAVYISQHYPVEKNFRLQLVKGRTKKDVAATRMFEDFHPGGGPQSLSALSLLDQLPDFFNPKKMKWFSYKKEILQKNDERILYVISFDQQPSVHEALEKGTLYIDANDFTLLKYECINSPIGIDYIKSLQGTDKLMAKLLNIDFKRKSWKKLVEFEKENDQLILKHAAYTQNILYKQPKKNINLDISITMEMLVTENAQPVITKIDKQHEWKRKNIPAALPGDFDEGFWGTDNIIQPTKALNDVIRSMNANDNDPAHSTTAVKWKKINNNMFYAAQINDSIILMPLTKGSWNGNETAGLLYQTIIGDFSFETNITASKRTDSSVFPENGFQQAGIMIKDMDSSTENNLLLTMGNSGNPNIKIFIQHTENGKSKTQTQRSNSMNGWLKLERIGSSITAFMKDGQQDEWVKINSFQVNWLKDSVMVGFVATAKFAGNGPKMKPDLKAVFSNHQIKPL